MRQALENDPIVRQREYLDPFKHRGGPDRRVAIRVGRRLLGEAHVLGHLSELGEIIAEEFPDVKPIKPFIDSTGAVVTGWRWNFRNEEDNFGRPLPAHEEITVGVWPISKVLSFSGDGFGGSAQTELMRDSVWRSKPTYVLDAMKRTYEEVIQRYKAFEELKERITTSK